jgi:hypothetical protein
LAYYEAYSKRFKYSVIYLKLWRLSHQIVI